MLNSYIISFSGFRIRRSKLILNSKNLLRIPYTACLMHFLLPKNPFFNPNLKTLITYRLESYRFAFSTFFQSRITQNIFCIAKTSLGLKMGKILLD